MQCNTEVRVKVSIMKTMEVGMILNVTIVMAQEGIQTRLMLMVKRLRLTLPMDSILALVSLKNQTSENFLVLKYIINY